jgi:hypothetical protein
MKFLCKGCGVVSEGSEWDKSSGEVWVESYESIEKGGWYALDFICPSCGKKVSAELVGVNFVKREDVRVWREIDGVVLISICDLLDDLYGKSNWFRVKNDESMAEVKKFMDREKVGYYADVREDFSEYKAYGQALQEGFKYMIVEDMS